MKLLKKQNNLFLIIFVLFIGLHLVLVCLLRIYPFVDLPNHLAAATIYRFYGEPTNQFAEFYSINTLIRPNLFHTIFCGLKIFPTVEFANKVFYCLYVLLLPLSVLLLIKKLSGNPWFSLLSFLVLYNFNVSWGFVGFTVSLPFILLLFYFLIDYSEQSSILLNIIVIFLFMLLFFMHALAALFSLLVFFLYILSIHKKSLTKILKKSIVAFPVLIIIIIWWINVSHQGPSTLGFLANYYKKGYLQTINQRAGLFFFDNFHLFDGLSGYIIAAFFSFCIIIPVLKRLVLSWKPSTRRIKKKTARLLYLFIFCSLFCFLFLPHKIPNQWLLYQRFSVLFLLSIIILGSLIFFENFSLVKILSICILCLLHLVLWSDYFCDFEKENRVSAKNLFPENSKSITLSGFMFDYSFRGRPIYIHFPNYYIIWHKGIASTRLVDYRFGLIRRRRDDRISLPPYQEWTRETYSYDGRYDRMDYLLIRGELLRQVERNLSNFKLIKLRADWSLYKNINPKSF